MMGRAAGLCENGLRTFKGMACMQLFWAYNGNVQGLPPSVPNFGLIRMVLEKIIVSSERPLNYGKYNGLKARRDHVTQV